MIPKKENLKGKSVRIKRLLKTLAVIITVILLCAVMVKSYFFRYDGDISHYSYRYNDSDTREWEEDIIELAQDFIDNHPLLSNDDYPYKDIREISDLSPQFSDTRNFFSASKKTVFLWRINTLLNSLSKLTDVEITMEMERAIASLRDFHSCIIPKYDISYGLHLKLCKNDKNEFCYFVDGSDEEYKDIIGSELISINDVKIKTILSRLDDYISYDENVWVLDRLINGRWILAGQFLKRAGVISSTSDSAIFKFSNPTGTVFEIEVLQNEKDEKRELSYIHPVGNEPGTLYYRDSREGNWHEIIDDRLYLRYNSFTSLQDCERNIFTAMNEVEGLSLKSVIVDLRGNGGGYLLCGRTLVSCLNKLGSIPKYVLVNENTVSAGGFITYSIKNFCENVTVVGSQMGSDSHLSFSSQWKRTTNKDIEYTVPYLFVISTSFEKEHPLPDIELWQTDDDCRNNIDTVLVEVLGY